MGRPTFATARRRWGTVKGVGRRPKPRALSLTAEWAPAILSCSVVLVFSAITARSVSAAAEDQSAKVMGICVAEGGETEC